MCPLPLDKAVDRYVSEVIDGDGGERERAQAMEAIARLDDYYEAIQDACYNGGVFQSEGVVVKHEGITIKFPNIESVAEWLYEH